MKLGGCKTGYVGRSTTLLTYPLAEESAALTDLEMPKAAVAFSLDDDAVNALDESFSQLLLRKIDEKGLSDAMSTRKLMLTAGCSLKFAPM